MALKKNPTMEFKVPALCFPNYNDLLQKHYTLKFNPRTPVTLQQKSFKHYSVHTASKRAQEAHYAKSPLEYILLSKT